MYNWILEKNIGMKSIAPHDKETMKRPSGGCTTFLFEKDKLSFFDKKIFPFTLFSLSTGQHFFLLERNKDMILKFFHFSPGTGTREASININELPSWNKLMIVMSWSPSKISLLATPYPEGGGITVGGEKSKRVLRVDSKGVAHHLGDNSDTMAMVHVAENGELIIQPTAIEVWKETLLALDSLSTGKSSTDRYYQGVVSNVSIVMLVTGFEAYTKRRFLEIEDEGINPRINKVIQTFLRDPDFIQEIKNQASEQSLSMLRVIVSRKKVNFQSFDDAKKAYNKAYSIQFGNLGISSDDIAEIKRFFKYRHKIIHVHPAMSILNVEEAGIKEQIKSDKELVEKAKTLFNNFIVSLHNKSLELVP